MNSSSRNIRLSVITPFHNASSYIEKCVHSLMRQSLQGGVEFIFIDDCSTDDSLSRLQSVVEAYPERLHQVTILHNDTNRGVAFTRQRGHNTAQGEFIVHCDADDWIDPEMYGSMLNVADTSGADIVCSAYYLETQQKTSIIRYSSLDFPGLNTMPLDTLHGSLWNKIIRRSLLEKHQIRFFEGIDCWEDLGILFRLCVFTQRIVIYNRPFYHYRRTSDKTLSTIDMERVLNDHLAFARRMEEWFDAQPPDLKNRYRAFIDFTQFTAKIKLLRGNRRRLHEWKTTFPETNRQIMSYKNIPLRYRLCFYAADRLPEWLVKTIFFLARIL